MTVLAWDGKTLAADSGALHNDNICRARKIVSLCEEPMTVVAWAGTHEQGMVLADWYWQNVHGDVTRDDLGDTLSQQAIDAWPSFKASDPYSTVLIVATDKGVEQYEGLPIPIIVHEDFWAWGSGGDIALGALSMGATAREAVEHTVRLSSTCFGDVESYDVRGGE